MRWKWKDNSPPTFCTRSNYAVSQEDWAAFEEEVESWITEGILVPWSKRKHGAIKNIILLMGVHQTKGEEHKVRPVLDFRTLNKSIESLPGGTPVCENQLREWRTLGPDCSVADLKRAYLQVYVAKDLWVYQAVQWRGRVYLLTRLGFGLNVAPKIMTAIVQKVLQLDGDISRATSSYIDDIIVTGGSTKAARVRKHLERYGLAAKGIEQLGKKERVRVLGPTSQRGV